MYRAIELYHFFTSAGSARAATCNRGYTPRVTPNIVYGKTYYNISTAYLILSVLFSWPSLICVIPALIIAEGMNYVYCIYVYAIVFTCANMKDNMQSYNMS